MGSVESSSSDRTSRLRAVDGSARWGGFALAAGSKRCELKPGNAGCFDADSLTM